MVVWLCLLPFLPWFLHVPGASLVGPSVARGFCWSGALGAGTLLRKLLLRRLQHSLQPLISVSGEVRFLHIVISDYTRLRLLNGGIFSFILPLFGSLFSYVCSPRICASGLKDYEQSPLFDSGASASPLYLSISSSACARPAHESYWTGVGRDREAREFLARAQPEMPFLVVLHYKVRRRPAQARARPEPSPKIKSRPVQWDGHGQDFLAWNNRIFFGSARTRPGPKNAHL
jgi:hypothetical protein